MEESLKDFESEAVRALGGGNVVRQAARRAAKKKVVTVTIEEVKEQGLQPQDPRTTGYGAREGAGSGTFEEEATTASGADDAPRQTKEIVMPSMFNVTSSSPGFESGSDAASPSRDPRDKKTVRPSVFSFDNAHPAFAAAHFLRTKAQDEMLRQSIETVLLSPKQKTPKRKRGKKKKGQAGAGGSSAGSTLRSRSVGDLDLRAQREERGKRIRDLERGTEEVEALTPPRRERPATAGEAEARAGAAPSPSDRAAVEEEWQTIKRLEGKILQLQSGIQVLKKSDDFKEFWQEVTAADSPLGDDRDAGAMPDERSVTFAELSENAPSTSSAAPAREQVVSIPSTLSLRSGEDSSDESETDIDLDAAASPAAIAREAKGKRKLFQRPPTAQPGRSAASQAADAAIAAAAASLRGRRPQSAPARRPTPRAGPAAESSRTGSESDSDEWQPSITMPKPFSFLERDAERAKTKPLATVKMEQDLLIKRAEEESERQVVFKAKKIPKSVLEARYNNMIKEQETMRMMKHVAHIKHLSDMEKPFAFYLVDKKRQEIKQKRIREALEAKVKVKPFRANTVPASTYVSQCHSLSFDERS